MPQYCAFTEKVLYKPGCKKGLTEHTRCRECIVAVALG